MKETKDMKRAVYAAPGDQSEPDGLVSLENKPAVYSSSNGMMGGGGAGLGGGMGQHSFPTIDLTSGMTTGESTSSSGHLPRPHGVAGYDQYSSSSGLHQRKVGNNSIPTYSGS